MCVNYVTVSRKILYDAFDTSIASTDEWKEETYQDYVAPIIRATESGLREGLLAAYSMVPKSHIPPGVKRYSTMNARAETVGQLRSYAPAWRAGQLCLIPMQVFFEPNWETGAAVRWKIGMADESPFAVAGIYRSWQEQDGTESFSFTQLTINADDHALMKRFHKPGDEKRSLVVIPRNDYDEWLNCIDPERARAYLQLPPPDFLVASASPRIKVNKKQDFVNMQNLNRSLF